MLTRVKSFFIAALVLLVPSACIVTALVYPDLGFWNFGFFISVMLTILYVGGAFAVANQHNTITNAPRFQRPALLAKLGLEIEKRKAVHFTGRGFLLGMLQCFLIALLVYAGSLFLAAIMAVGYVMMAAMTKSSEPFYNDEMAKIDSTARYGDVEAGKAGVYAGTGLGVGTPTN